VFAAVDGEIVAANSDSNARFDLDLYSVRLLTVAPVGALLALAAFGSTLFCVSLSADRNELNYVRFSHLTAVPKLLRDMASAPSASPSRTTAAPSRTSLRTIAEWRSPSPVLGVARAGDGLAVHADAELLGVTTLDRAGIDTAERERVLFETQANADLAQLHKTLSKHIVKRAPHYAAELEPTTFVLCFSALCLADDAVDGYVHFAQPPQLLRRL
jgi:hypothetical protein